MDIEILTDPNFVSFQCLVGRESKEVVACGAYDRIEHVQVDGEVEVERGGGICPSQKENRSSDETILENHLFLALSRFSHSLSILSVFRRRADRLLALSLQPKAR